MDASSPWASPEACAAALASGLRAGRVPNTVRIATWNVRWFPDGGPGNKAHSGPGPQATRVEWLACALAWLDADAVALQEIKSTARAEDALRELTRRLDEMTGGRYRVERDHCDKGTQHVAWLFDERKVQARSFRDVAALNPRGDACADQLRPGLGGYFVFKGGLDVHLVSVHFKSGGKRHELDTRRQSFDAVAAAYRDLQNDAPDSDVVLVGDFNTMGCSKCSPKVTSTEEIGDVDRILNGLEMPFRRIPAEPRCSEYYRGEGQLLDHFVVDRGMREAPTAAKARVFGYCGELACGRVKGEMPRAYLELSDHCPVALDLSDRDLD